MGSRKYGSIKMSTPVVGSARGHSLPRPGVSTSFSPIARSDKSTVKKKLAKNKRIAFSSSSDGSESKRRKLSTTSGDSSWETSAHQSTIGPVEENPDFATFDEDLSAAGEDREASKDGPYNEVEKLRDAPPPITEVEGIIDVPLFPRPQLGSTEILEEDIRKDAPYVEVPAPKSPDYLKVKTPTKTYLGTRPLMTAFKGEGYWRKISSERTMNYNDSGIATWLPHHNYEAERLWKKYCAKEAEERYASQQASQQSAPPRRFFRNRDRMLKIRDDIAKRVLEEPWPRPRKRRRKRKPSRSPSPEMIRMQCELDGPWKVVEDNGRTYDFGSYNEEFDPHTALNQREEKEHAEKTKRILAAAAARKRRRRPTGIIIRSYEPFIGPLPNFRTT